MTSEIGKDKTGWCIDKSNRIDAALPYHIALASAKVGVRPMGRRGK